MTETTRVDTPEGRNIEILNPLNKYDFKPVPSQGFEGKVSVLCSKVVATLTRLAVDAD